METLRRHRLSTMQVLAIGFLGVILLGAVVLYLPICNRQPVKFIDALFMSVTSVCVTGLVTVVPATQFTLLGKVVILLLIQIGGLGIVTCATGFFLILRRQITTRERVIIGETYNMKGLSGLVAFVIRVLKATFIAEAAGAVCYAFAFVPDYGWAKGIFYSVFHSVSAFCNAGIDILGDESLAAYAGNPLVNITTMLLIIAGGLGFAVWHDLRKNAGNVIKNRLPLRRLFTRLSLHSKITLLMTAILITFGTVVIYAFERENPQTMGSMSGWEKWMAGAFQSVTTRTAGFATVNQGKLRPGTKFICVILMLIGGSPGGTAGGIKTTTMAMLVLTCLNVIYGRKETEAFGRSIPEANFRTGFAVAMSSMGFLTVGVTLLTALEPKINFLSLLYEAASAIGTVGLTAGITPSLRTASKAVVMCLMFIGRLGPVTIALVFGQHKDGDRRLRELPPGSVMVG